MNIQYSGEEDTQEGDEFNDMYTFCDSDPKKGCILVDAVKFWPNYWAPHTMFEKFDAALPQDMKWSAGSEKRSKIGEICNWLKTPNLFGENFQIKDKHFRSKEDMFMAARWAVVINAVGKRYFENPNASFSKFPRQSIAQTKAPAPQQEPEEESPARKRSRLDQLGAASGSVTMGLLEEEEGGAVPNKKKRKARAVKEFEVTWDTKLESSNMTANHVSQAFALMNTRRITPAEGISVSAKSCIEPALPRLARPLEKTHVSHLQNLYIKEQHQGDLWVVWKQLRLSCSFVITWMCSCVNCLC